MVRRQVVKLAPVEAIVVRPEQPFLPPGTLVLTDQPQLLEQLGRLPEDLIVLTPASAAVPGVKVITLQVVSTEAVDTALAPIAIGSCICA